MKSIKVVVFCMLTAPYMWCQMMLPNQQDTSVFKNKHEVLLSGIANYQSSSMGKDISKSFFYGGYIDDAMKNTTSARQQLINRYGINVNTELSYRNHSSSLFKDSSKGLILQYGFYNFTGIQYSEDLFDLLFFGNSAFIGDTAFLSGSRFDSYTFQKVGFGWFNKYNKSSITFNAVGVQNVISGAIQQGAIYQSASLDTLHFEMDASYRQSSNNKFCGFGLALDADYRFHMPRGEKERIYFQLLVRNLGVVCLPNARKYNVQSTIEYSSYTLDQLLNASTVFNDTEEAVANLSDSSELGTNWRVLPALMQFSKLVDRDSERNFQGFYGARAYLASSFIPMVFAGLDVHPAKWCRIGIQGSYGGFSNLRWGMYSDITFNNFSLGFASENLFSKTGESIIFRMSCVF